MVNSDAQSPQIPGEIGYDFETEPEMVQIAQPLRSRKPLRMNTHTDGVDFPSPGIQVDAHIGGRLTASPGA